MADEIQTGAVGMTASWKGWSAAWVLLAVYIVVAAAMFGWAMPAVVATCGAPPLDGRFTWSRADALALMAGCDEMGLRAYTVMAALDLVYPALLAAVLVIWTLRVSQARSWWLRAVFVVPAVIGMLADYLENLAVWSILAAGKVPDSRLIDLGGRFSIVKNVAGAIAFTVLAGLIVGRAVRRQVHARETT